MLRNYISKEKNMFKIKSEVQFDMAHYLSGYNGKCSNIHGHRYKLIAQLKSETLHTEGQLRGMVDDFSNFKNALKKISIMFDHKLIIEDNEEGIELAKKLRELPNDFDIEFVNYRPTAEEMSRDIFNKLKAWGLPIYEVELFETPNNSCIYTED
jgi:6-pyruvoyltetrahydropterin/6-carboxytetrahydropterin synthase